MTDKYEPDERFVDRLEWQLASEHRRLGRWRPPGRRVSLSRGAVAAGVMVGVLLCGVTVIKAADYIKDSWRKKIEVARAETNARLAKLRLGSMRDMAARSESLLAQGLTSPEEGWAVAWAAERAEVEWRKARLDLDEVMESGEPPRNEIHAPLVGGRDFVGERLEIDLRNAERELKRMDILGERTRQLAESRLVSGEELSAWRAEAAARKGALDEVRDRLELRKRFVSGAVPAEEVEIQGRLASAEARLKSARAKVEALEGHMARLSEQEGRGEVLSLETGQLRSALEAAKAEMRLASLEKEILEQAR